MLEKPGYLGKRGSALWDKVVEEVNLDAAGLALLEDICRTADIIHKLDVMLASNSDTWVKLAEEAAEQVDGDTVKINIVVNPLLGEIRQQRLAMRQMMGHLKIGAAKGGQSEAAKFWAEMEKQFQDSE